MITLASLLREYLKTVSLLHGLLVVDGGDVRCALPSKLLLCSSFSTARTGSRPLWQILRKVSQLPQNFI